MAPDPLRLSPACPACGLVRREGWTRCPRCRTLLFEGTPGRHAAVSRRPIGVWLLVACAVTACMWAAYGALSTESSAPAAARASDRAAPNRGEVEAPAGEVAAAPPGAAVPIDGVRAGAAAYSQGDLQSALVHFEAAVEAAPGDAEARNNLAQVLVRLNRVEEALPHFEAAIEAEPARWAYRFNRARALAQIQRWTEAVVDYREAARLFPDDYATYYNLGLAFMELRRYGDAVNALERAVALAPSEPSFLITLGTAYVGLERPDRARAAFARFLELAPRDAEAPRVRDLLAAFDAVR